MVESGILLIVVESLWLVVVETIVVKTVVVETGFLVVVETLGLYSFKIFDSRKIKYLEKLFHVNGGEIFELFLVIVKSLIVVKTFLGAPSRLIRSLFSPNNLL